MLQKSELLSQGSVLATGSAELQEGASLFIAGASGAIGTVAIQLARRRGLRVGASASEYNHDYLRSLGAEFTVDYHDADWMDSVRGWIPGGVDAAMAVQPGTLVDTATVVRDGGIVVPISDQPVSVGRGIHVKRGSHDVNLRQRIRDLLLDATRGDFHIEVEKVCPFEDALSALAKVQTRRARGKMVITLE